MARGSTNVQGEEQKKLDVLSNEIFLRMNEWGGHLAGMASEEMEAPIQLDGAATRAASTCWCSIRSTARNIDVNVSVGSIFSILRAPRPGRGRDVVEAGFPAARHDAGRRRLRDLRPVDDAGADGRQRRRRLHARPEHRRVRA
jgi:fructose-1,6-bisphosphatase